MPQLTLPELIRRLEAFCMENYENGYDTCVECWGKADYEEFINDCNITSVDDFVKAYADIIAHANEIRSTAW